MKIIDLLNKIANGEEVPERINWGCHSYEWKDYEYKALDELGTPLFSEQAGYTEHCLNDEVAVCSTELTVKEAEESLYKISEALYKEANKKREKKIPEKLYFHDLENITENEKLLVCRINSILDYLESKGE